MSVDVYISDAMDYSWEVFTTKLRVQQALWSIDNTWRLPHRVTYHACFIHMCTIVQSCNMCSIHVFVGCEVSVVTYYNVLL